MHKATVGKEIAKYKNERNLNTIRAWRKKNHVFHSIIKMHSINLSETSC